MKYFLLILAVVPFAASGIAPGSGTLPIACPEGTVWDPSDKVCVQPGVYHPVGKCPPIDSDRPVFLPDSEDPAIYYMCSHGKPIKMKCPSGLVFDHQVSACVWPSPKGCPCEPIDN